MSERIRCKICKVETEVDENGRCRSCREAYEATEIYHTTYGKLKAQKQCREHQKLPPILPPGWKICPQCGKRFFPNHGKRIYCSDLCGKNARQAARNEKRAKERPPIQPKICAICGKEFIPCRNDKRIKYCGIECYELSVMEHHRTCKI